MSRRAAWPLYALLSALVLGGALLAAPTRAELGLYEVHDCAAFLALPRAAQAVRLLDCELDFTPLLHRGAVVVGPLHPASATLPPEARAEVRRAQGEQPWRHADATRRSVERWAARGDRFVDLSGDVTVSGSRPHLRLSPSTRSPGLRAFGVALVLIYLPLLVVFRRTDRRWSRALESCMSGASQPTEF